MYYFDVMSQPNKRSAELAAQRRGSKPSAVVIPSPTPAASGEMEDLREQLSSLNESSGKPPRHASAGGMAAGGGNASLLKRAKVAEEQVEALRKQLEAAERNASRVGGKASGGSGGGSGGGGGADPMEIKKLQRRIKELESQGGGGGGNAAGDKKALAAAEKKFEKQMKETEKANRKEKASLEGRVSGLEKELEDTSGQLREAVTERDQLRQRVKELGNANAEMEKLREKVCLVRISGLIGV
jgi:DNA repair exonuclease SbcCD ATPase subunit